MDIKDKTKKEKIAFRDLRVGEVFRLEEDFLIKINDFEDNNAFNLSKRMIEDLVLHQLIIELKATLIIE